MDGLLFAGGRFNIRAGLGGGRLGSLLDRALVSGLALPFSRQCPLNLEHVVALLLIHNKQGGPRLTINRVVQTRLGLAYRRYLLVLN